MIRIDYVYEDVLSLFMNIDVTKEHPLRINFEGEEAVDYGGVCRDMFAAFWEKAYEHLFDGSTLLTPAMHAGVNFSTFPILGRIISHGYIGCGYLPVRIAFPCLSTMLDTKDDVSNFMLLEAFASCISPVEASFLKSCFTVSSSVFSCGMQEQLIALLSRFGCREVPTPRSLRQQAIQMAKFEFTVKPMAAVIRIKEGIPPWHHPFWNNLTTKDFHFTYKALTASPSKVLQMLEEPILMTPSQERVHSYLVQYVGQMKPGEAEQFLRFVTGSTVCISNNIHISFNALSGLARRPLSHTCDCSLELSSEYRSYLDFSSEFTNVLSDKEYSWVMDAV